MDFCMPQTIWPCWAYALCRAGKIKVLSFDFINDIMPSLLKKYNPELIQKGPILVWRNNDTRPKVMPVRIFHDEIIWAKCRYDYHAAFYEGDGFFSEMTPNDETVLPFIIRKRMLSETSAPNFVIDEKSLASLGEIK